LQIADCKLQIEKGEIRNLSSLVIPAEAGIHLFLIPVFTGTSLDSRLHACALKRYGAQARE